MFRKNKISKIKSYKVVLPVFFLAMSIPKSLFASEFEDGVADTISWVVIVIVPIVAIGIFLMVHVLPEKIAEKRNHPQAAAIKTLCILSLFFGGILWPLAWLWTYSKPVFYKMAYGTDKGDYHEQTLEDLEREKRESKSDKPKNSGTDTDTIDIP